MQSDTISSNKSNSLVKGIRDGLNQLTGPSGASSSGSLTVPTDMASIKAANQRMTDYQNSLLGMLGDIEKQSEGLFGDILKQGLHPGTGSFLNNSQPGNNTQPAGDGVEKDDVENRYVKFHAEGPKGSRYLWWVSPSTDPKDRQDRDFKFDRDGYKLEGRVRGGGKLHFGFILPGSNNLLYDLWF